MFLSEMSIQLYCDTQIDGNVSDNTIYMAWEQTLNLKNLDEHMQ